MTLSSAAVSSTASTVTATPTAAAIAAASSVIFIPLSALLGRICFGLLRGTVHPDPVVRSGVIVPAQAVAPPGLAAFRPEIDADDDQNKRGDADNEKSKFHAVRISQRARQARNFATGKGAIT